MKCISVETVIRYLSRLGGGLVFVAVLASLLLSPQPSWTQTASTGALKGTVADATGAVIAGAQVKVTNASTGEVHSVKSQSDGSYAVPLLLPGRYRVEISHEGFKKQNQVGLVIHVTETAVLNVRLEVGAVSTVVQVAATPEVVQTDTSTLGEVVSEQTVESLPLVNRNFTQITDLSAGVVSPVTLADELGRGSGGLDPLEDGSGTNVNGGRAYDNSYQMNGVNINDFTGAGAISGGIPIPNPDTIQEFKVQTGLYDAGYGRNAGANVDIVTKTGSSKFHGSVYEFWRNDVLNANDYFLKEGGAPRPELKQNQFGGTIGGPIVKDKLLFFGAYQGTRQVNGLVGRQTVFGPVDPLTNLPLPLTDDRSPAGIGAVFAGTRGFFQDFLQKIYGVPFGPAIAADGSNINPVALKVLQAKFPNGQYVFPSPNPVTDLISFSVPASFNEEQGMANVQFLQSSKNTLEGRTFFASSNQTNNFPGQAVGGGNLPGVPVTTQNFFTVDSISDNYTFSPNLINQFRFGYDRSRVTNITATPPFTYSSLGVTSAATNNDLACLVINGSYDLGTSWPSEWVQNLYDLQDTLSWVHGHHNVRFGGGLTQARLGVGKYRFYGENFFLSWPDFLLGLNGTQNGTFGLFSNVYLSFDGLGLFDSRNIEWEANGYAQDDFKVNDRLTLNLGFRYEWLPPGYSALGHETNFDRSLINPNPPASGSYQGYVVPANYPASDPFPAGVTKFSTNSSLLGTGQHAVAPRFGFSYKLLPNSNGFVLHGGYGIYYSSTFADAQSQGSSGPPFTDFRINTSPTATEADPFTEPIPPLSAFPIFIPYSPTTSLSTQLDPRNFRPAMTQQYTLSLQSELSRNLMLEVAYVGTNADHLIRSLYMNQAALASASNPIRGQTTNTVANVALRVPYEGFNVSGFREEQTEGRSNYNSLQVTLKKRLSKGLQVLASYTWSRTLDTDAAYVTDTAIGGGGHPGDQYAPHAGYGPSSFSRPHRLIVSYLYDFPQFNHGPAFARYALSGWAISGVTTFQAGTPLTITYADQNNVYGIPTNYASYAPGCSAANAGYHGSVSHRVTEYFNTSCFTSAPIVGDDGVADGFGNTSTGILRGPDQRNFDLALSKTTKLGRWESANVEFRAEFFNAFNTTQFANPSTGFQAAGFGVITGTSVAPRVGQLALKLHF
jgi:hypothetical protein